SLDVFIHISFHFFFFTTTTTTYIYTLSLHDALPILNNLISDIETVLRFKIKNYFLNYYLIVSEKIGKEKAGENWAEYLEYGTMRSEEHTSELQSRFDLVCRLLLEKKKNNIK